MTSDMGTACCSPTTQACHYNLRDSVSRAEAWPLTAGGEQMRTRSIKCGLRVSVAFGWLFLLLSTAAPASELRRLSIDDIVSMATPQAVRISPDGKHVAFVLSQAARFKEPLRRSIWVVPATGGKARPYTSAPTRAYSPQWSPNSRSIAFLGARSAKPATQVYLMDVNGGEARPITDHPTAVRSFDWSADGSKIVYLAAARESRDEQTQKSSGPGYDEIDVGPSEPVARRRRSEIWIADIETGVWILPEECSEQVDFTTPPGSEAGAVPIIVTTARGSGVGLDFTYLEGDDDDSAGDDDDSAGDDDDSSS